MSLSLQPLLRKAGALLMAVLDSDHDGRMEFSDLPGTLEKLAAIRSHGLDMAGTAIGMVDTLRALAGAGKVKSPGGELVTPDDVDAAWEAAKAGWQSAGAKSRALLGQPEEE